MAEATDTTVVTPWNSALGNHAVALDAWNAVVELPHCPARDQVGLAVTDARNTLFSTPAPTHHAAAKKLEILWGKTTLFGDDPVAEWKRRIIGDILRIERIDAGIEELEASGRTAEQQKELDADWAAAQREHDELEKLLAEGRSDRWGGRRKAELVAMRDEAEASVLSLSAPTLHGVIRKLELLLREQIYDEFEGTAYLPILSDLRRLARPSRRLEVIRR